MSKLSNLATSPVTAAGADQPSALDLWAADLSPVMSGLLASRQFIIDRLPQSIRTGPLRDLPAGALQASREANPKASIVGDVAFPIAAGVLAPGAGLPGIAAQGAAQGGLEFLRQGSTFKDVAQATALGSGGQVVGNATTRVLSGIAKAGVAKATGKALETTSKRARTLAETGAGRGMITNHNKKVLNTKIGKALGVNADDGVNSDVLAEAAEFIGGEYKRALQFAGKVDTTEAYVLMDDIPGALFPGKARVLATLADGLDAKSMQAATKQLRKIQTTLQKQNQLGWADEVQLALDDLTAGAIDQGADPALIKAANQRWKVLKTIESMPESWQPGREVSAGKLASRFGRETDKGFGTAIKRTGADSKLLPEVQELLQTTKKLAGDVAQFGDSGTAGRGVNYLGTAGALGSLAAGEPALAGGILAGQLLVPPLAAAASIGSEVAAVGGVLAGTAQALKPRDDE